MSLLAKSVRDGVEKTLHAHIEDDLRACEVLFGARAQPTRLAQRWLQFFRLPADTFPLFWANTIAAVALHDLGKANDGFQGMLREGGEQAVRHEQLSAFLLCCPNVADWLAQRPELDLDLISSAVLGHHLQASEETIGQPNGGRETVRIETDHADLAAIFASLGHRLGLPEVAPELPRQWSFGDRGESIDTHAEHLRRRFRRLHKQIGKDQARRALYLAVKTAVIVSDSAGSGLAREGYEITAWLAAAFGDEACVNGTYIEREVLKKRIAQIERRTGKAFAYQDFQECAATQPDRTLMIAPCGAGKTLAAWRWIAAQLDAQPRGRVLFLYPTRATATEGFRDYVAHAPESDASLLTGTAAYELRDMFSNPDDPREGVDYLTEARLYALGYWSKRVFSATVDQFLGFIKQNYKGICLLPVLADAVVVVDEVHSFDVGLFGSFRKFLAAFDVPVLAMTASLPEGRRCALQEEGMALLNSEGLADLETIAEQPRYRVELGDLEEVRAAVRAALVAGERVLWVVNTVDRAQALADEFSDWMPLCYHSRFTLDDRKCRHAKLIESFQDTTGGARLAITTQVAEMSLDLDAQVLVSELAPISALIQRMGRCNRYGRAELGRVWFYAPDGDLPYERADHRTAEAFVAEFRGRQVSQANLEAALERYTAGQGREADHGQAFLDDGPWAMARGEALRDGVDYTTQAVLDTQLDAVLAAQRARQPIDGFIVPVPHRLAQRDPQRRLPHYLHIAPASHYTSDFGFLRAPVAPQGGTL